MLPKYDEIWFPLILEIAKRGDRTRPLEKNEGKNVYEVLAEYFNLTQEDLEKTVSEPTSGSERNKWENMVRWARSDLVKFGLISSAEHGVWELTEKGKEVSKMDTVSAKIALYKAGGLHQKEVEIFERCIAAGISQEKALLVAGLSKGKAELE